ncbi:FUSC family protein [Gordonia sp. ABSL11-1]|uniref:FUSC family protein n=1 Tax=Gordonia sp. ABSL11-1 TaxID=3053924 RepID=UPI002572E088|nr:FUSC family protein [Gordonia sp. ABSL11-1]MDL9945106.1 FUSC family protein [Gordonia sp. ABSL11-1]
MRSETLRPDGHDHRHALRVAAGLAVPGMVLLIAGRPDLMVYAAFGSFAGMYGRTDIGATRLRQQLEAACLLTAGVVIGVLLSAWTVSGWVLVAVGSTFAALSSLLADRLRLRPVGPFFFLFALGATATVPPSLVAPAVAIGICAATAALAVAIGLIGVPREGPSREVRRLPRGACVHAVRYAVAVGAAGALGMVFGFDHANWAMAAAAVPLGAMDVGRPSEGEVRLVLVRAIHRVVGTAAGLVVAAALLAADLGPSALAALMMALLFPTELFMTRHYAVAIGFFTPLIMLMTELADPSDPAVLLTARGWDTLIGVVTGVVVVVAIRGHRRSSSPLPSSNPAGRRRAIGLNA